MSRDSKEKDKLISLSNDLLQWRDPERDRDLVFVQRQPFLTDQTDLGQERGSDSIPRTLTRSTEVMVRWHAAGMQRPRRGRRTFLKGEVHPDFKSPSQELRYTACSRPYWQHFLSVNEGSIFFLITGKNTNENKVLPIALAFQFTNRVQ